MPARRERIDYKASVQDDLEKLDPSVALRVLRKVETALTSEGRKGDALAGAFSGLYRLRVGDYRVIYARTDEGYLVLRIAETDRKGFRFCAAHVRRLAERPRNRRE